VLHAGEQMQNIDYLTRFEAYLLTEQCSSHHTVSAYKRDISQLLAFMQERQILLTTATAADLKEFVAVLYVGQTRSSTRARKIAAIRSFYRYLHVYHQVPNTAQNLHTPKQDQLLPRYLSQEEIQKLLCAASQDTSMTGKRNEAILYVLYGLGVRVSELISLTISDIQFDLSAIKISTAKGNKQRLLPMPEQLHHLLHCYITEVRLQSIPAAYRTMRVPEFLFIHLHDNMVKKLTRQMVWSMVKRLCVAAGIQRPISPHQLRHSLATHMLSAGADVRSLQVLLGHERLSTVQVYTHVETEALRTIYDTKHPRSR
jgi:integrase/recombinase XerD